MMPGNLGGVLQITENLLWVNTCPSVCSRQKKIIVARMWTGACLNKMAGALQMISEVSYEI